MKKKLDPKRLQFELELLRARLREMLLLADEGREERIQKACSDFGFFCRTYFPHQCASNQSAFHDWVFNKAPGWGPGARVVVAAPRGNAKTTLLARLYVLWRIIRKDTKFAALIQDSTDQAEQSVEVVKIELEDNPRLARDFPDLTGPGRTWQKGEITTRNRIKVKAYGSGKRIRGANWMGRRPDLVIIDDLENDENVRTRAQREKLYRWFTNAVLKLGPPDGSAQTLMIGTVMHSDAVLVRVSRRPDFRFTRFKAVIRFPERMDLWEEWERVFRQDQRAAGAFYRDGKSEMDKGAEVLWPGVQPLYELMCERAVDREAFSMEMQNEPLDPESRKFPPENFTFFTDLPRLTLCVGALDPAMGKSTGDYTGIVVLGKGEDNKAYVLEADIARYAPTKAVERILHYQKKYGCVRWGVENVAFQAMIMDLLVQASLEKGVPVPAVGIKPRFAKEVRIEALAPHVANGVIRFDSRHSLLLDQLCEWPKSAHDDGPDALEMAFGLIHAATPIEFKTPKQGHAASGSLSGEKRGF